MHIKRSYIAAAHDFIMAAFSFVLSFYLRVGYEDTVTHPQLLTGCFIFTLLAGILFYHFNLYKGMWRYASLADVMAITKAVTCTILVFSLVMFLINRLEGMPRSVFLINWMVLLLLLGGPRFLYRTLKEKNFHYSTFFVPPSNTQLAILLVGLNDNTEAFLREIKRRKSSDYKAVGIIDNHTKKLGSKIHDVEIYGQIKDLPDIYHKLKALGRTPQKLLITSEHLDGTEVRNLLKVSEELGMSLARIPNLTDFKYTDNDQLEIKPIVIQDLLGRAQNAVDRSGIKNTIAGKRVLITGAGGTIGSELTRQLAKYSPSVIILLDNSEYNLYSIDQQLSVLFPDLTRHTIIADIRNKPLLDHIFTSYRPEILFHAAALKHVPLVEENICEAVLTNIIGTRNLADCCQKYLASQMVMISTDKAVNPANVMGATKRAAEKYIQALRQQEVTQFVTVRFGNVLGSSGSVIPLFEQQIKNGGPITVTHPDIVRYFMTVREAVELVLQSSILTSRGGIFVLDMGQPIKITELASQMIKMSGLRPEIDIKIEYVGLRPGEKLFEELFYNQENLLKTPHASIMQASPEDFSLQHLQELTEQLRISATHYDIASTIAILKNLVPEYIPNS